MSMYCKLLIGFLIFGCLHAQAQTPPLNILRGSPSVTANDARGKFILNLGIPVVADTSHALNGGLDSLGLVVQVRSTGDWWRRDTVLTGGHKWTMFGSGTPTDTTSLDNRINQRVVNLGGATGLFVGPELSRPAPGTPGRQYTSSDSGRIWLDIGVDWLLLSGSGSSITTYVNTTISGIRAATTASTAIGYSLTDVGAEGSFMFIPTDHSTPDDTWRTLVDAAGHRYRRAFTGPAHFSWFQPAINSTSDQSALVLQAIHQAGHSAYGIIFDSGVYYCKSMFDSDANYLHIEGPGTLKNHSSAAFGTYLLTIRNCKNVSISGLHFDGNYPIVAGSPTGGTGMIALDRDTGMVIRDVYFANNGYACINSYDCKNVLVDNMNTYMTDCGFQTLGNCENITVENSTFLYGTSAGVDFFGRSGANILYDRNCRARNNRAVGKNPGVEFRFVDGFLIDGNFTDSCQNGIAGGNINTFGPSHDSRFTNPRNGIITNNIDSNSINASIVGPCTHCKVNGNMSYQAGGFGIEFGNATDSSWKTTIDNNTILNWGRRIPACAAIRILNNFKGSLKNNMLISDSNNTCMDIQHSDSLWVESNIAQSLANYQWVASSSTNIFGFNNSGKWHGPFQGVLTYGSYNYGFSSDTTGRATDTTNYKIWVYNPTTGKWGYFSNWQNLVGQNIIRPSPTFPNRLYASSISDSLLFGYTSTGTPIGTFNVTGLSDFKGGIQGTWSETITANKSYNRQVDATFNGGTTFNAHSFTYNINAASIGNNSPNGLPLFMTDNANSGSNTVNGFYSLFTKNGTGAGSDIHHNTSTTVNSGFTLSQDIGYNYAPPVGAGNTTQSIGFIMNGSSSSTLSKYDGYVVQNSTAANAIVNGINSALDGSAGHRLIYSAGMAPSYHAGLVNIGTDSTLNSSALLNLTSTSKGVLLTRMNTAQMLAIVTPATYLVIFNTDSVAVGRPICYYTGSTWKSIGGSTGSSSSSLRIGPKDSAASVANGATAVGNNLYLQTVDNTNSGMATPKMKLTTDSLNNRLYQFKVNLVNKGSGGYNSGYNSAAGDTFYLRNDSAGLWGKVDTTADGKVRIGVDSGAMMPVLRTAFAPIGSGGSQNLQQVLSVGNKANIQLIDTERIRTLDTALSMQSRIYGHANVGDTIPWNAQMYFWGDSWTRGTGADLPSHRWATLVAQMYGAQEFNFGVDGNTLAAGSANVITQIPAYQTYMTAAVFMFGINDGNVSTDTTAFKSYYRIIVDTCIARGWPKSKIVLLMTGYAPGAGGSPNASLFAKATATIADSFGVKKVDIYNYMINNGGRSLNSSDSLHPNTLGHHMIARAVEYGFGGPWFGRLGVRGNVDIYKHLSVGDSSFLNIVQMTGPFVTKTVNTPALTIRNPYVLSGGQFGEISFTPDSVNKAVNGQVDSFSIRHIVTSYVAPDFAFYHNNSPMLYFYNDGRTAFNGTAVSPYKYSFNGGGAQFTGNSDVTGALSVDGSTGVTTKVVNVNNSAANAVINFNPNGVSSNGAGIFVSGASGVDYLNIGQNIAQIGAGVFNPAIPGGAVTMDNRQSGTGAFALFFLTKPIGSSATTYAGGLSSPGNFVFGSTADDGTTAKLQVTGRSHFTDTIRVDANVSESSNLSSLYTRYSKVSKTYADSMAAAKIATAITGLAVTSGNLSQFAATTSAQLASVLSDETGTGLAVFGTSPTLSNPVVGTQTAGDNSTKAASTAFVTAAIAAIPGGSGTPFSVLQKYSGNLGSTYDARTFVDKNYADSMAAAKIAAAVDGGQYTPTVTNITNASSVSGVNSFYSVTNKRVSAEVVCDITTTSANTLTTVEVSLPIASPSLSGGGSITGHGMVYVSGSGTAGNWIPCEIEINASGHDAALVFLCGAAAGYIAKFTISYMAP